MALGYYLRQERERTIVRAVTDADAASGQYVYRPNGAGATLYAADGSRTGTTSASATRRRRRSTAAVPLVDWTDIEHVLHYRATQVHRRPH